MPSIQVAPIYTDAWAKTTFMANAQIIERQIGGATTTLLGVTCSPYWVRFFFTEINLLRWVEDSSIATWSEYQRCIIPVQTMAASGATTNNYTELYQGITNASATPHPRWPGLPFLSPEDSIVGFGCKYAIPPGAGAGCAVTMNLWDQPSNARATAAQLLATAAGATQSATYVDLSYVFASPLAVSGISSPSLGCILTDQTPGTAFPYIYAKRFYIDKVRLT